MPKALAFFDSLLRTATMPAGEVDELRYAAWLSDDRIIPVAETA